MVSCGPPEFEKNTRILVKGNVVDEDNNPLTDIKVDIYTARGYGLSGEKDYSLGSGTSGENGAFAIPSLFDNNDEFQIEITGTGTYSSYYYSTTTEGYTPWDLTFNLGVVTLSKLAKVNFNITRTSPPDTSLFFTFNYQGTECFEFFNRGVIDLNKSNCLNTQNFSRQLNQNRPEASNEFNTLMGSVVEFTYKINDEPEITEQFTIDKENYEFNFSY